MSARTTVAAKPVPAQRACIYEMKPDAFSPTVIEAARIARVDVTQLKRLNKISTMCRGMATVVHIIANNEVVEDNQAPDDPTSEAPLSRVAISYLEFMVAEICEQIADDIDTAAAELKSQVKA
jgi:hypothetical protein